jgi:hypothetical protein
MSHDCFMRCMSIAMDIRGVPRPKWEGQAEAYYRAYWLPSGAAGVPWPLCLAVLDTALDCGTVLAGTWCTQICADFPADQRGRLLACMEYLQYRRKYYALLLRRYTVYRPDVQAAIERADRLERAVIEVYAQDHAGLRG